MFKIDKKYISLHYKGRKSFDVNKGLETIRCYYCNIVIDKKAFDIKDGYEFDTLLERLYKPKGDIVYMEMEHENGYKLKIFPPYSDGEIFAPNEYQTSELIKNKLVINISK